MSQVFRVERNRNFTVMANYHLKDKRLSLKAKGLRLCDMKWNNDSLENAIKEDDFSAIHDWMETILERACLRQRMLI